MIATPVTPGSATASIFGETKLAARQSVATSTVVKPSTTPPPMPPSSPVPRPTPEEVKARRLRRLADERVQALEGQAKQPPSTFQPTFQQLRRKTAPARRALLDLVARQPKEVGILSFVLFMVAMAMLGSGSLGAEVIGLFVLIAALVGGAAALLAVSRNVFDRHDPR
jgi:hypothetical protein